MYLQQKLWLAAIMLLGWGCSSLSVSRSTATLITSTTTGPPKFSVADLLRHPPASGARVEVDAYFNGVILPPFSIPAMLSDDVSCPLFMWNEALTARPVPGTLSVLNSTKSNPFSDNAPWLIASTPEATRPSRNFRWPQLPYHARLRGHMSDPALAKCSHADRIFIVEQVVKVYESLPPSDLFEMKMPPVATWPRSHSP